MNRTDLLKAGLGIGAASLVPAVPNLVKASTLIRPSATAYGASSIVYIMRQLGCTRIDDLKNHASYYLNGTVKPMDNPCPQLIRRADPNDSCGGGDYTEVDPYTIGAGYGDMSILFTNGGKPIQQMISTGRQAPYYYLPALPPITGLWTPYSLATCIAALGSVAGQARTAATYIVQNAGRFSAAVAASAQAALAAWSGTGLGISAAGEFLVAICAGLSLPELAAVIAACGFGAAGLYVAIHCIQSGG